MTKKSNGHGLFQKIWTSDISVNFFLFLYLKNAVFINDSIFDYKILTKMASL